MKFFLNPDKFKDFTMPELYREIKNIITNEQLGGANHDHKLELIYSELEKRNRLDIYNDALKSAASDAALLNDLFRNSSVSEVVTSPNISKYDLMNILNLSSVSTHEDNTEDFTGEGNIADIFGFQKNFIICRVTGDSMEDINIFDGDSLVVVPVENPSEGDIVITSINGEKFVKRYHEENGTVWLVSENKGYSPVEISDDMDVKYLGTVKSVVHKFC